MRQYKHFIFDLDGTLLDTIEDIAHAITAALHECGFNISYDREGTTKLINNGADMLVRRALSPIAYTEEDFQRVKSVYLPYYRAFQGMDCLPFPKISKTLQILNKNGISLAIVTNKPDELSQAIIAAKLPDIHFDFNLGHKEGYPVKPDPYLIQYIFNQTGWLPQETLFVGDSNVDLAIAKNAGIDSVLCVWGYDNYTKELCSKANYVIQDPEELLSLAGVNDYEKDSTI